MLKLGIWHMLYYVTKYADFEFEVRLAWNLQKDWWINFDAFEFVESAAWGEAFKFT